MYHPICYPRYFPLCLRHIPLYLFSSNNPHPILFLLPSLSKIVFFGPLLAPLVARPSNPLFSLSVIRNFPFLFSCYTSFLSCSSLSHSFRFTPGIRSVQNTQFSRGISPGIYWETPNCRHISSNIPPGRIEESFWDYLIYHHTSIVDYATLATCDRILTRIKKKSGGFS